ncbi:MAG: NCS2 family permease [Planctomycetota bacterium]|jgi:AGZA family xanthine/uracil permease-like MFS transporter
MRPAWAVRGDVDGFVGLFIDNLLQLMLIYVLCQAVCGMEAAFVTRTILPGAAISILIGNLFYAWQARRLMQREGRDDVTALPYGINTPSLIAFVVLIMGPVYREFAGDGTDPEQVRTAAKLAWQAGLFACLCSGVMETGAAFVGQWLRRVTPRAALLSALAGIAITFIAMGFVFQMFASPAIAVLPMLMILFTYAGRVKLPLGLPGGVIAIALGVALAWFFRAVGFEFWQAPDEQPPGLAFSPPRPVPGDVLALVTTPHAWRYFAVIVPMGLFNIIGSLQNLESAEAAGDRYETRSSLLVNGIGTVAAACFGSAFPTTIYIGHPGWKAMGARAAYSVINGIVIAVLCLAGGVAWVLKVVPLEVALGILLWIAVVMTAQAFAEVPKRHALAVALGLVPALAAWALLLIQASLRVAGMDLRDAVGALALQESLYVNGVAALSQGFLVSSMVLAAILVFVIERRFLTAAGWTLAAALLSAAGLIHGFEITAHGVENRFFDLQFGPEATNPAGMFAVAYALGAAVLVAIHFTRRREQE